LVEEYKKFQKMVEKMGKMNIGGAGSKDQAAKMEKMKRNP